MTDDKLKKASIPTEESAVTLTDENGATLQECATDNKQNGDNDIEVTKNDEKNNKTTKNKKDDANKPKRKLGDVAKCTIVLSVIALVAGVLLGIVNWVTYVDPDGVISDKCTAYFASATAEKNDKLASYDYDKNNYVKSCFVAKNGEEVVGYCYYSVGGGAKDGSIELLVFIGSDGVIKDVAVYEQGETAGYFDKVEKANKQKYVGLNAKTLKRLELVKNKTELKDGEISAVSSATYTSTGYHNAIAAAVYAYRTYIEEA